MILEICCENIESVLIASKSGADRIELCSSLETGGLTPSIDLIKMAQDYSDIPLMILIRPRSGNFVYSELEKLQALKEVESTLKLGVQGVVTGALTSERKIDIEFMKEVSALTADHSLTFHRAFDFLSEPMNEIQNLLDLAIDRVLTSGGEASAEKGMEMIKKLIDKLGDEIIIMPGASINNENIQIILENCNPKEIHLSAKRKIINSNSTDPFPTDQFLTDADELKRIIEIIRK